MESKIIPNISQSLIKALFDYKSEKECGHVLEAKYIKKIDFPSSELQRLGNWFEYECTGALPRNGLVPIPERIKSGELSAPYRKMQTQVDNFKKTLEHYNIKILEVGKKLVHDGIEGTVDIIAEWDGRMVFIDLKSSGLINDKWNDLGWCYEALHTKDKLLIQAVHYKLLSQKIYGEEVPFYFFVFSNTNEVESVIYEVNVDETRLPEHENTIKGARNMLKDEMKKGFKALPEIKRCNDCPLKAECEYAASVPKIYRVDY